MSVASVIVAGGTGERFGREEGKQLAPLAGRPLLAWTVQAVAAVERVEVLVVACDPSRVEVYRDAVEQAVDPGKPVLFVAGGDSRQQSVAAGLAWVAPEFEAVVVHDGARPLAEPSLFDAALDALFAGGHDGVVVGHPSVDTLKCMNGGVIESTPERSRFWTVQTPQVFKAEVLRIAHNRAIRDGFFGTDDAALVERAGGRVAVIEGPRDNIKVTVPEDLAVAEAIVAWRLGEMHP